MLTRSSLLNYLWSWWFESANELRALATFAKCAISNVLGNCNSILPYLQRIVFFIFLNEFKESLSELIIKGSSNWTRYSKELVIRPIGGERVTCHGPKLANCSSLGWTNSLLIIYHNNNNNLLLLFIFIIIIITQGGTPYNGLYGEAPPKKGYLFQASGI